LFGKYFVRGFYKLQNGAVTDNDDILGAYELITSGKHSRKTGIESIQKNLSSLSNSSQFLRSKQFKRTHLSIGSFPPRTVPWEIK
jgi:hypothetical protein